MLAWRKQGGRTNNVAGQMTTGRESDDEHMAGFPGHRGLARAPVQPVVNKLV